VRGTSTCDVAVVVAASSSSSCGPVATAASRDGSPIAAALAIVHDAHDERRLVVTGAPDLSTLAGVRAGTIGITM
jgi:hypothetical protein